MLADVYHVVYVSLHTPHFYISPPFPTLTQIKSFVEGYGVNNRVPILFVDKDHVRHVNSTILNLIDEDKPIILFIIPHIGSISRDTSLSRLEQL